MRPGSPCLESPLKWKKGGKRTQSPNPTKLTAMSWWGPLPSGISYWGEGAISSYFLTEGHISLQSYSKWISWAHFWKWPILYLNCHLKSWHWPCHKYNTFFFVISGCSVLCPPSPKFGFWNQCVNGRLWLLLDLAKNITWDFDVSLSSKRSKTKLLCHKLNYFRWLPEP